MIYKIILPLIFTTISVLGEISLEFKYLQIRIEVGEYGMKILLKLS